jgi:hypothetical protein
MIGMIGAACAGGPRVKSGVPDSAFADIPFEQWLSEGDQHRMRWTARVTEPELSSHQRLAARIEIMVDGAELARRRGKGELFMLMQISAEQGGAWQDHEAIALEGMPEGVRHSDAVYFRNFFVTPGEYRVAIALYDTATREHSLIKRRLHVSPLRNDPLPEAWTGLPAVEFVRLVKGPDAWYLPFVRGRLNLAGETKKPADIDLLLNLTPAERFEGSSRVQSRNLAALIPSMKVLSQLAWRNASLNVTLLDLSRQQVAFQQEGVHRLEWRRARGSLQGVTPGMIDVKSLENRKHSAQFFVSEVGRRLGTEPLAGEGGRSVKRSRVVIVLSAPVSFEPGQDLRPIELNEPHPDTKVFYVRYQPQPTTLLTGSTRPGPRRGPDGVLLPPRGLEGPIADDLEPLLRPIEPRLFDVTTPEQFRRALASMLAEIGQI